MEQQRTDLERLAELVQHLPEREPAVMDEAMTARLLAAMEAEYAALPRPRGGLGARSHAALKELAAALACTLRRWREAAPVLAHRCREFLLAPLRRWQQQRPRLKPPAGQALRHRQPTPPQRLRRLARELRQSLERDKSRR